MNCNEKVSIIMPSYNCEKYIESAIDSVLNQTYTNFELIVIDDCSLDDTYNIIIKKSKTDKRIKVCRNETNLGVSKTRNKGVLMAENKWIAFLDSDDMWKCDKLEKQVKLAETKPDAVLFYTGSAFVDEDNKYYDYIMNVEEQVEYKTLLRKNIISCSSVMVKRDVMLSEKMQGDEMHEDYTAWLSIVKKFGKAYGVNEPLLVYRLSHGSKSSNRIKAAKMSYNSYRYIGCKPFVAAFYVVRYTFYSVKKRYRIYRSKK